MSREQRPPVGSGDSALQPGLRHVSGPGALMTLGRADHIYEQVCRFGRVAFSDARKAGQHPLRRELLAWDARKHRPVTALNGELRQVTAKNSNIIKSEWRSFFSNFPFFCLNTHELSCVD